MRKNVWARAPTPPAHVLPPGTGPSGEDELRGHEASMLDRGDELGAAGQRLVGQHRVVARLDAEEHPLARGASR